MPTFNRVMILPKSVDSLLNQDYADFEVIVINDASTDATAGFLEELSKREPRVRAFRNEFRKGLPLSRNIGTSRSRGELVYFTEDDLLLDQGCISRLVDTYNLLRTGHRVGAIAPRLITRSSQQSKQGVSSEAAISVSHFTGDLKVNFDIQRDDIVQLPALHACALIPKQAIAEVSGYETSLYEGSYVREETDFYYRLRRKGYELFLEPRAKAYHYTGMVGGCILNSRIRQEFYNVRNHLFFLIRFYGISTLFMFPCFVSERIILAIS
ncbi:MAG: glycosyltransferase family 2 protein [Nitrososphaerales archaeon]